MSNLLTAEAFYSGLKFLENGNIELSFELKSNRQDALKGVDLIKQYNLKEKHELDLKVAKKCRKRSLDANAYAWVLIGRLAEKLKIPKEEIYRQYIKDIGCFEPLPIRSDRVEAFKSIWEAKGVGWVLEVIDDSKLKGYKLCHAYFGSSTYNTDEMSRLIDLIVQDCKEQEIETMTPAEIAELKSLWGQAESERKHTARE